MVTDNNTNETETITDNPYTFAGTGVRDRTTDWIHYGARYYSTRTGAFTQQDTLDAPLDPANANRYAYAGGDPINLIDPTGRANCLKNSVAAGLGGLAAGAIFGTGALVTGGGAFTATGVGCLFLEYT